MHDFDWGLTLVVCGLPTCILGTCGLGCQLERGRESHFLGSTLSLETCGGANQGPLFWSPVLLLHTEGGRSELESTLKKTFPI